MTARKIVDLDKVAEPAEPASMGELISLDFSNYGAPTV
jgi:hypothetical protein